LAGEDWPIRNVVGSAWLVVDRLPVRAAAVAAAASARKHLPDRPTVILQRKVQSW
jgi:hypothetical protein